MLFLMMTKLLGVNNVTSLIPPSTEGEGTGEDESDEGVEGIKGQTTSFLSFRSSSCREYFYILEVGFSDIKNTFNSVAIIVLME